MNETRRAQAIGPYARHPGLVQGGADTARPARSRVDGRQSALEKSGPVDGNLMRGINKEKSIDFPSILQLLDKTRERGM